MDQKGKIDDTGNHSALIETLYFLLGVIAGLLVLIFFLVNVPFYIFRQLVVLYAKWNRLDFGEVLNPLSSLLFQDLRSGKPPRATIVVTATLTSLNHNFECLEQDLKKKVLRNWIQARDANGSLKYPKFQQYPTQWMGYPFFRNTPEPFDINNHIYGHKNLDGKGPVTPEQVEKFIEELLNRCYVQERSPWEMHLVDNYRDTKCHPNQKLCLLILRIHHCMADGYGLLYAFFEGLCEYQISEKDLPVPKLQKRLHSYTEIFIEPFIFLREVGYVSSQIFRSCRLRISDQRKVWHQHCVKSNVIPIQRIKDVKNYFGVSFTSVLLSSISAALCKHLSGKISSPKHVQKSVFSMTTVPLSGHSKQLTNHVTAAVFDIPSKPFVCPSDRLYYMQKTIKAAVKDSSLPYISHLLGILAGSMPAYVAAWIAKNGFAEIGLTNFPSVNVRSFVGGYEFLDIDFAVGALQGKAGIVFAILSFGESIRINVIAEKGIATKMEAANFVAYIETEIFELYKLCQN